MWEISNSQNLESGASTDKFVVASKKCSCSYNLTIINFRVGILSWDKINLKVKLNSPSGLMLPVCICFFCFRSCL